MEIYLKSQLIFLSQIESYARPPPIAESRRNENIPLKNRLSGFSTSKYTNRSNDMDKKHRMFQQEERGYDRSSNDRYQERRRDFKHESASVMRSRHTRESKFTRNEEPVSEASDESSDSSNNRVDIRNRLNSFVSTSTMANKKFSKI